MTPIEIAGIAATAFSAGCALKLLNHNVKIKTALQKQKLLSDMWRKSSESVFLMAQKSEVDEAFNHDQYIRPARRATLL
jgi:hypothetical protein